MFEGGKNLVFKAVSHQIRNATALSMANVISSYAEGISTYLHDNHGPRSENVVRMVTSLGEELIEAKDEIAAGHAVAATKELADAIHAFVWIFVFLLPQFIVHRRELYYLIFFFAGVLTPYKQGKRYMDNGCIRSPRNCEAGDHICNSIRRRRRRFDG